MATVTGLTAARMLEIEAMSIVNGAVDLSTGVLTLQRHDGSTVVAGNVRGVGLQPGGTTGQGLVKKSNDDYNAEWRDLHELPSGGTAGQTFFKKSDTDYDAEWRAIAASDIRSGQFEKDRIPQLKAIDYKIDILYNDPNPITMLRSVPGSNTTGGVVMISPLEFGAIFNNEWKVRFDSSGAMTLGSVPGERIAGGAGSISPYVVPNFNRNGGLTAWWCSLPDGGWGGNRLEMHRYAVAWDWHIGMWNDNGTEVMLSGHDGNEYIRFGAAYRRTTTAAANMVVGASGEFYRSTSLRSEKIVIESAPDSWVDKVWQLEPRTWIDRASSELLADALARSCGSTPGGETTDVEEVDFDDLMVSPLRRIPGFVAEEVEAAGLEEFLTRDTTGELTGLAYDRFSAALRVAMKDEREKRLAAEARLDALEARLVALESSVMPSAPEEIESNEE